MRYLLLFIFALMLFLPHIYAQTKEQPTRKQVNALEKLYQKGDTDRTEIFLVLPLKHCPAYFLSISTFIDSVDQYLDTSYHEVIYIVPELREVELNYYFKNYLLKNPSSVRIIQDNEVLEEIYAASKIFPFIHIRNSKNEIFTASFSDVLSYFQTDVLPLLKTVP